MPKVATVKGDLAALVGLLGTPSRAVTVEEMEAALRRRFGKRRARG